jgi:hypothetical protein
LPVIRPEATRPISIGIKFLLKFNLLFLDLVRITIFCSNSNRKISISDNNLELLIFPLCFIL